GPRAFEHALAIVLGHDTRKATVGPLPGFQPDPGAVQLTPDPAQIVRRGALLHRRELRPGQHRASLHVLHREAMGDPRTEAKLVDTNHVLVAAEDLDFDFFGSVVTFD